MPWKEPGDKPREPRDRQSWGQGGRGNGPEIEAWLRKARRRLGPFGRGPLGVMAIIVLLIVLWFAVGGWTVVGDQQVGVLLRFGRLERVLEPGLHLRLPSPVSRVQVVDKGRARTLSDETRFLTADGQLALIDYYVQYKVTDARKFLFSTRDAAEAARNAATVAARAVVGAHTLEQLQQRHDGEFGKQIRSRLDASLAQDELGIAVTDVGIQHVGVPSHVRQAFEDIAKAREDAKVAEATARSDVAGGKVEAEARAAALKADAARHRQQVVADAKADVARFDQILAQFRAAPDVTRHRLWLEAMHDVLVNNRVVVNTGLGNVIVQFPAPHAAASSASPVPASSASAPAPAASSLPPVTSGPAVQEGAT